VLFCLFDERCVGIHVDECVDEIIVDLADYIMGRKNINTIFASTKLRLEPVRMEMSMCLDLPQSNADDSDHHRSLSFGDLDHGPV